MSKQRTILTNHLRLKIDYPERTFPVFHSDLEVKVNVTGLCPLYACIINLNCSGYLIRITHLYRVIRLLMLRTFVVVKLYPVLTGRI